MKRIILALFAAAGLAVAAARADHVDIRGSINLGAPTYVTPGAVYGPVYGQPAGYWTDSVVNVWIPAHWVVQHDYLGRPINYYQPAHYETRTQRVWVNAYRRDYDRDHGRRDRDGDRDGRRDWDDRDGRR